MAGKVITVLLIRMIDIRSDQYSTTRGALVDILNPVSAFLSYRDDQRRRNKLHLLSVADLLA
jgi:hypothetical protein